MPIQGEIKTLYKNKNNTSPIFPTTKVKAVSDENGIGLDALLRDNYATKTYVTSEIAKAQVGGDGSEIDLSGFATKDYVDNIKHPISSVNNKTGTVVLTAEDVGARPNTWMPTAEQVGAHPNTWLPTIAQIGAAPAGYGYGEALKGFYRTYEANLEGDLDAELAAMADKQTKQIAFSCSKELATGATFFGTLIRNTSKYAVLFGYSADNACVFKAKGDGVWTPFEWVNPPMVLATEYRTTERFEGKAVYAMAVDCGTLPNNSFKNVDTTIPLTALHVDTSLRIRFEDGGGITDGNGSVICYLSHGGNVTHKYVHVETTEDRSMQTAVAYVKYVKD